MQNRSFLGSIPPVTLNLIIVNFIVWLAALTLPKIAGINLNYWLGLHYFAADDFNVVQLITYMFLHDTSGIEHIFFNMFSVFMFGRTLEAVWGGKRFLFYYITTGMGAALVQEAAWYFELRSAISETVALYGWEQTSQLLNNFITVGASGAAFGILLAFGMLFPNAPLFIIFIPIPIKAKYFVIFYGLLELFFGVSGSMSSVAHFAHLGGMLFGFFLIRYWKKKGIDGGGSIIDKLKQQFQQGSVLLKLIYINVAIFLLLRLTWVVLMLFNIDGYVILPFIEMPSIPYEFITHPWTLLTYMFVHYDVWHILFNILWLYWFGQIFLMSFSEKQMVGLYLLGGIAGGLLYLLSYNLFPYFDGKEGLMCGASASIIAIVVATAFRMPDYKVNLLFLGAISLKYIALVTIVIDLLSVTSANGGGHIAHLGGALLGYWFIVRWEKGKDLTAPVNKLIDKIVTGFKPRPKIKVSRPSNRSSSRPETDMEYRARKKKENDEIDSILDKIKKSGYTSLSAEEKKRLFEAGKK